MSDSNWPSTSAQADEIKGLDRPGVARFAGQVTGEVPSIPAIRKWPIPYRQIGRKAIYQPDDVLAFLRKRFAEAPVRRAGRPINDSPTRTAL